MGSRRPLYLEGRPGTRVRLEGPALTVQAPRQAPAWYPLRRLSRIVVGGEVDWEIAALAACLRAGIVVSVLDGQGRYAGLCLGARPARPGLAQCIEEFALRPDWQEHYRLWYSAMERRAVLEVVRRLRLRVPDLRPRTVRRACMRGFRRLAEDARVHRVQAFFRAALAGMAAQAAKELGITPQMLVDESRGLRLMGDLASLMQWEALILTTQALARDRRAGRLGPKALAAMVERRRGASARKLRDWVGRLIQRIGELNDGGESGT